MKKHFLFFLYIVFAIHLGAQDNSGNVKKKKKAELRLSFLKSLYESGAYDEAIAQGKKLSRTKDPSLLPEIIQAKLLEARSCNALFMFKNGYEASQDAVNLVQGAASDQLLSINLRLTEYYIDTDDLITAQKFLISAEKNLEPGNEKENNDFLLVKARLLFKQGFLKEASSLVIQQTAYCLRSASDRQVDIKDKRALTEKLDLSQRKEIYGHLLNLTSALLLAQGQYTDAETAIRNSRSWIGHQIGSGHPLYRESLEHEAELSLIQNQAGKAASVFIDAYNTQKVQENEQHRILNLTNAVSSFMESDQVIKTNNYLRRLQMYAFRSVGPDDPYEIAFEYAQAYKAFLAGDFSSCKKRLNKISENFAFLPPSHYWNIKVIELRSKAALKSGDLKAYKELLLLLSGIYEKYYGAYTPVYHKARLNLAMFEIKFGSDLLLSEQIMQKSYEETVKPELASASKENILYLTAYAELFGKKDRYDSATVKAKEAAEITQLLYGENSAEYGYRYSVFTEYQIMSGKYKDGFENLQKASRIMQSLREGDHEVRQNTLVVLSRLYTFIGEYEKSRNMLSQAYKLSFSAYEKQLLSAAETAEQQGAMYLMSGNYFKAEKALMQALKLKEDMLHSDNPVLLEVYQQLSRLHLITGNYNEADKFLSKAIRITEVTFTSKSLRYAESQIISADYYLAIGDYKKAENACLKADEIVINKLGKNNLRRAEILSELAFIRFRSGSHKSADIEKLYKEADNIIRSSLGENNPLSALLSQKQAELFISAGKYDKAGPLLAEAEKFWTAKLGSENQYAAQIQLLKGDIGYALDKYDQAEKNYKKAQQLFEQIFTGKHPQYIKASGKLARVYYMKKDPQKSLETMEEIIPKYLEYTVNYFPSLSFREKSKFWNNMKEEFEFYNFIALNQILKNPRLSGKVYNNLISTKALLLSSNLKIRESILASKDSLLIGYFNQWINQKEYLTTIISLTKQQLAEQKIDPKEIEEEIELLEREISKRSEEFNGEEKKRRASWTEIRNSLQEKEYAIETLRIRYFNKNFTDSVIYAALIVNNKSESPDLVTFPDGKKMEKKFLKIYRNSIIYKLKDKDSYHAYWEPLDSKISEGATVYFSGDGVYNQLNLETLISTDNKYVLDKTHIVLVSNTKDLLNSIPLQANSKGRENPREHKKTETPASTYLLCGNPDFYSAHNSGHINPLPGAEQEVDEIHKVLTANGKNTVKFLNKSVTEDTLKKFVSPTVFHIATHGYFKEQATSQEEEFGSNPLLNSGLLLYGSGDILNNSENSYVNHKEGILTAYEAANLSFDHTELVVLSACETGRGEVQVGEGVYGLQRAFLIAGADAVIMSLFKVNDEITQKLMVAFYNKWLKTGNKRTAFIDAKREIRQEYDIPLYWGAFIMIEGKPQVQSPVKGVK